MADQLDDKAVTSTECVDYVTGKPHEGTLEASLPYTAQEERHLRRKFDKHIMSLVFVIFTLSYLDRSNIGNANIAGLSEDLDLDTHQFQWLLTAFYIGYAVFEFTTIAWKMFRPKYWACTLLIFWGAAAMGQGACNNWAQLMVCRFLLGTFEAMMTCGIPLYLSFFYFRHELGLRIGLLLSSSPLGSAWAGALAYGLTSAKTSIAPWRLLFVVEGAPTIVAVVPLFFLLVDGPLNAKFLNTREKEVARARFETTQSVTTQAEHQGLDHKVSVKHYIGAFLDYKNYIVASMHFAVNVSVSSISVFVPVIIKEMGFTSIHAQGLSAPPYVFGAICVVIITFISDRFKMRGPFVSIFAFVGAVGYLLQASCSAVAPRYLGIYLAAGGLFSAAACNVTWLLNNQRDHSSRGAALAILQTVGQCGSFLGTRLFPKNEGPYYRKGSWTCFGFLLFVCVLSATYSMVLRWENRRLDRQQGVSATVDVERTKIWRLTP